MVSLIPKKLRQELGKLVSWMEDYGDYLNSAYTLPKGGKLAPAPRWGYSARNRTASPEFNFTKLANELAPKVPYIQRQLKALGPMGGYYSKFFDVADIRNLAALSESGNMRSVGKANLGALYGNLPAGRVGGKKLQQTLKKYNVR